MPDYRIIPNPPVGEDSGLKNAQIYSSLTAGRPLTPFQGIVEGLSTGLVNGVNIQSKYLETQRLNDPERIAAEQKERDLNNQKLEEDIKKAKFDYELNQRFGARKAESAIRYQDSITRENNTQSLFYGDIERSKAYERYFDLARGGSSTAATAGGPRTSEDITEEIQKLTTARKNLLPDTDKKKTGEDGNDAPIFTDRYGQPDSQDPFTSVAPPPADPNIQAIDKRITELLKLQQEGQVAQAGKAVDDISAQQKFALEQLKDFDAKRQRFNSYLRSADIAISDVAPYDSPDIAGAFSSLNQANYEFKSLKDPEARNAFSRDIGALIRKAGPERFQEEIEKLPEGQEKENAQQIYDEAAANSDDLGLLSKDQKLAAKARFPSEMIKNPKLAKDAISTAITSGLPAVDDEEFKEEMRPNRWLIQARNASKNGTEEFTVFPQLIKPGPDTPSDVRGEGGEENVMVMEFKPAVGKSFYAPMPQNEKESAQLSMIEDVSKRLSESAKQRKTTQQQLTGIQAPVADTQPQRNNFTPVNQPPQYPSGGQPPVVQAQDPGAGLPIELGEEYLPEEQSTGRPTPPAPPPAVQATPTPTPTPPPAVAATAVTPDQPPGFPPLREDLVNTPQGQAVLQSRLGAIDPIYGPRPEIEVQEQVRGSFRDSKGNPRANFYNTKHGVSIPDQRNIPNPQSVIAEKVADVKKLSGGKGDPVLNARMITKEINNQYKPLKEQIANADGKIEADRRGVQLMKQFRETLQQPQNIGARGSIARFFSQWTAKFGIGSDEDIALVEQMSNFNRVKALGMRGFDDGSTTNVRLMDSPKEAETVANTFLSDTTELGTMDLYLETTFLKAQRNYEINSLRKMLTDANGQNSPETISRVVEEYASSDASVPGRLNRAKYAENTTGGWSLINPNDPERKKLPTYERSPKFRTAAEWIGAAPLKNAIYPPGVTPPPTPPSNPRAGYKQAPDPNDPFPTIPKSVPAPPEPVERGLPPGLGGQAFEGASVQPSSAEEAEQWNVWDSILKLNPLSPSVVEAQEVEPDIANGAANPQGADFLGNAEKEDINGFDVVLPPEEGSTPVNTPTPASPPQTPAPTTTATGSFGITEAEATPTPNPRPRPTPLPDDASFREGFDYLRTPDGAGRLQFGEYYDSTLWPHAEETIEEYRERTGLKFKTDYDKTLHEKRVENFSGAVMEAGGSERNARDIVKWIDYAASSKLLNRGENLGVILRKQMRDAQRSTVNFEKELSNPLLPSAERNKLTTIRNFKELGDALGLDPNVSDEDILKVEKAREEARYRLRTGKQGGLQGSVDRTLTALIDFANGTVASVVLGKIFRAGASTTFRALEKVPGVGRPLNTVFGTRLPVDPGADGVTSTRKFPTMERQKVNFGGVTPQRVGGYTAQIPLIGGLPFVPSIPVGKMLNTTPEALADGVIAIMSAGDAGGYENLERGAQAAGISSAAQLAVPAMIARWPRVASAWKWIRGQQDPRQALAELAKYDGVLVREMEEMMRDAYELSTPKQQINVLGTAKPAFLPSLAEIGQHSPQTAAIGRSAEPRRVRQRQIDTAANLDYANLSPNTVTDPRILAKRFYEMAVEEMDRLKTIAKDTKMARKMQEAGTKVDEEVLFEEAKLSLEESKRAAAEVVKLETVNKILKPNTRGIAVTARDAIKRMWNHLKRPIEIEKLTTLPPPGNRIMERPIQVLQNLRHRVANSHNTQLNFLDPFRLPEDEVAALSNELLTGDLTRSSQRLINETAEATSFYNEAGDIATVADAPTLVANFKFLDEMRRKALERTSTAANDQMFLIANKIRDYLDKAFSEMPGKDYGPKFYTQFYEEYKNLRMIQDQIDGQLNIYRTMQNSIQNSSEKRRLYNSFFADGKFQATRKAFGYDVEDAVLAKANREAYDNFQKGIEAVDDVLDTIQEATQEARKLEKDIAQQDVRRAQAVKAAEKYENINEADLSTGPGGVAPDPTIVKIAEKLTIASKYFDNEGLTLKFVEDLIDAGPAVTDGVVQALGSLDSAAADKVRNTIREGVVTHISQNMTRAIGKFEEARKIYGKNTLPDTIENTVGMNPQQWDNALNMLDPLQKQVMKETYQRQRAINQATSVLDQVPKSQGIKSKLAETEIRKVFWYNRWIAAMDFITRGYATKGIRATKDNMMKMLITTDPVEMEKIFNDVIVLMKKQNFDDPTSTAAIALQLWQQEATMWMRSLIRGAENTREASTLKQAQQIQQESAARYDGIQDLMDQFTDSDQTERVLKSPLTPPDTTSRPKEPPPPASSGPQTMDDLMRSFQ